ncbi:MAG: hypothetical protein DHS20C21_08950 [Gemmatimonadota bacterium]|nr:MAG: hypothetical protein DHS20C21_08950 [Gemmatimonadota bacterium]
MLRILLRHFAVLGVLGALHPGIAGARTWSVNPDGTADALTIQAGLALAADGDSVVVACGTYLEYQLVMKSGVTLISETGQPDCVTIDAEGRGRVFYCLRVYEGAIVGFTATGGSANYGGGIFCVSLSAPRLENCVFTGNRAIVGGGAYLHHSPLVVENCVFTNNQADYFGGGLAIEDFSDPELFACDIMGNTAGSHGGGVWSYLYSNPTLDECRITGNVSGATGGGVHSMATGSIALENTLVSGNAAAQGGAVGSWSTNVSLTGCTVTGNSAAGSGGGLLGDLGAAFVVDRTILWDNCAADGREVSLVDGASSAGFECSDVDTTWGAFTGAASPAWTGTNFSADPLFCDALSCTEAPSPTGTFDLGATSPCLEAQTAGCGRIGAFGPGACNRSAESIAARSWGRIKASYRSGLRP